MVVAQRCLKCFHTAYGPGLTPDKSFTMCIAAPPSTQLVSTPDGTTTIAIYPLVNAQTISCAMFMEVPA